MLLLKLYKTSLEESFGDVFTFHYASIKTAIEEAVSYFEHKFTFHYASIKTMNPVIPPVWLLLFTFHYASIKTETDSIDLMLDGMIYISLCFY